MYCALTFKDEQYLYIFETFYRCGFNDNVILEHSLTLSLLIMSLCNTNLGGPKVDGVTTHGELQPIFLGYFEDEVYWYVIIYQFTIYLIIYFSARATSKVCGHIAWVPWFRSLSLMEE